MPIMFLAQGLNQTANIIKGFAIAIGIAIAVGFVWMWWAHRQRERRQEMAARARGVWQSWLRLAVEHPELADPAPGTHGHAGDVARYKAFVASLIMAADEVLLLDDTAAWRGQIARQLAPHRAWLASPEFERAGLAGCTMHLRALIGDVVASGAAQPGFVPVEASRHAA